MHVETEHLPPPFPLSTERVPLASSHSATPDVRDPQEHFLPSAPFPLAMSATGLDAQWLANRIAQHGFAFEQDG